MRGRGRGRSANRAKLTGTAEHIPSSEWERRFEGQLAGGEREGIRVKESKCK